MKTKKYTNIGSDIRKVLIGMIVDPVVVSRISAKWKPEGLFNSRYQNLIGNWCVKYYLKYNKPIGNQIESIFEHWAETKGKNQNEIIEMIERLLGYLSSEYEQNENENSSDYILDKAGELFNRVKIEQLKESIEVDLERGDVLEAEKKIQEHNRVELGPGEIIKLGESIETWRDAFDETQTKPLVTYPGALGKFFGNDFARDSFVVS